MTKAVKAAAVEWSNCAGMYKSYADWFGGLMSAIHKLSSEDVDNAMAGKRSANFHTVAQLASIGEYLAESAESDATIHVEKSAKCMAGEA